MTTSTEDLPDASGSSILHVDMDAFFASVEVLHQPELRDNPVLVGGTGPRGVVAAASYEARIFGARSAMPMSTARRLCPTAVVLPANHELYRTTSRRIMAIFADFTPLVEPLSLDEAFLDVSSAHALFGSGREIAEQIRRRVLASEGLHCSVGVARSKHVAKLASDAAKPRIENRRVIPGPGVVVVGTGDERAFLRPLPVRAMWGVGPRTFDRLVGLGLQTVGEVADLDVATLAACLGDASGRHLHALANGRDDRSVEVNRPVKSISQETTFPYDLVRVADAGSHLVAMADQVASRLRAAELFARTVTIKVRLGSFETMTRSRTLDGATASSSEIAVTAKSLLAELHAGRRVFDHGVRLLGVAGTGLTATGHRQLSLDIPDRSHDQTTTPAVAVSDTRLGGAVDGAVDAIRARFGSSAIVRGQLRGSGADPNEGDTGDR